jgi:hypothetical protein
VTSSVGKGLGNETTITGDVRGGWSKSECN